MKEKGKGKREWTHSNIIKTIQQPCHGDEKLRLRQLIPDADAPSAAEDVQAVSDARFVAVEPAFGAEGGGGGGGGVGGGGVERRCTTITTIPTFTIVITIIIFVNVIIDMMRDGERIDLKFRAGREAVAFKVEILRQLVLRG